jgi:hypothetical protein
MICPICDKAEGVKLLSPYYAVCNLNYEIIEPCLVYADEPYQPICQDCLDNFDEGTEAFVIEEEDEEEAIETELQVDEARQSLFDCDHEDGR